MRFLYAIIFGLTHGGVSATQIILEMFIEESTAQQLGFDEVREALAREALTPQGKALCRALAPTSDIGEIQRAQARIKQLIALMDRGGALPIEEIDDIEEDLSRATKFGTLTPEAIRRVARAMLISSKVRKVLLTTSDPQTEALSELGGNCHDLLGPGQDLLKAFDESGELRDSASPELFEARRKARGLAESIRHHLEKMIRQPSVAVCLQEPIITLRQDRYVLPVRSDTRGPITGIVHDTSQSGATLFIEPHEVIEDGNRLKIASAEVHEQQQRILQEYTSEIASLTEKIHDNLHSLAAADFVSAAAKLKKTLKGELIDVTGEGFALRRARHPGLALAGSDAVPNDIELPKGRRALIVSGPNAGGKTVVLKTVGLMSLMAQSGLPVSAAEDSRIGIYTHIFAVIGDEQDLHRGLSTFSAHVAALARIFKQAGPKTLVLLDELAQDTDPRHGAALAGAIVRALVASGAVVLVSTHFEEIKTLAYHDPLVANASVGFDLENLRPTFILHPNTPGRSLTLDIARKWRIPESVVADAAAQLDNAEQRFDVMLANLERERQALAELQHELSARLTEVEQEAAKQKQTSADLDRQREELHTTAARQLRAEIQEKRREVASLIESLKRAPSIKRAVEASETLKRREAEHLDQVQNQGTKAPDSGSLAEEIAPGDQVRITHLNQIGQVVSLDKADQTAMIQVGSMRIQTPLQQIRAYKKSSTKQIQQKRPTPVQTNTHQPPEARSSTNTLVLRGMRADEALGLVDSFLDRLFGSDEHYAFLIHGHGTGALKKAVREYLKHSPYAQNFRKGTLEEGGDGVTVVKLK
jgi:DNA mismatch repair protein MutS2